MVEIALSLFFFPPFDDRVSIYRVVNMGYDPTSVSLSSFLILRAAYPDSPGLVTSDVLTLVARGVSKFNLMLYIDGYKMSEPARVGVTRTRSLTSSCFVR